MISRLFFFIIIIFFSAALPRTTTGFSAAPTSSQSSSSPWKTACWRLILHIGRESSSGSSSSSSTLPDEWGASGARLSFPIQIQVESEPWWSKLPSPPPSPQQQDQVDDDPLLGRGANRLRVINTASITYITERGEQTVPMNVHGGWKLRLGRKKGHASLLRFWLELGERESGSHTPKNTTTNNNVIAQKKDVTLLAKERLYFAAQCWRQSDLEIGRTKLQPLLSAYERAQAKLEDQVSHESGDRRLDGKDALDTLAGFKDMAGLTLNRDDKRRQLQEALEYLPPPDALPMGNWPGDGELLAIKPMELFVHRKSPGWIPKDDYYLIGTWEARPLNVTPEEEFTYYFDESEEEFEDDEYEYYDTEDENELAVDDVREG